MSKPILKFAIPKGSLQKKANAFFRKAGVEIEGYDGEIRNYRPGINIDGIEIKVLRPQEIPLMVAQGYYDLGISGLDWFVESQIDADAETVLDLNFGRVDIVCAVPAEWENVNSISEMLKMPKREIRIYTEYLNMASSLVVKETGVEPSVITPWRNVRRRGFSNVSIFLSFGATEAKPPEDAEAIIDNTETGSTLRANNLKIIGNVLSNSTARLIANVGALHHPGKSEIIELLRSKFAPVVEESKK